MPSRTLSQTLSWIAQAVRLEFSWRIQRKGSLLAATRAIRLSDLFDAQWYLDNNPDVSSLRIDPIHHYFLHGAYEGRSPHPLFDSAFYLHVNADVAGRRINPLLHFIRSEQGTWRCPHQLFDISFYVGQLSAGERNALANPLQHFLQEGAARGLDPHPFFSVSFYKDSCPDVDFAKINPLVHYLTTGAREGRNPHPLFDDRFYRLQAENEIGHETIGLLHFISVGARKGWSPHPWFDVLYYAKRYRDIQESGINPLWHYIMFGASELRDPCARFDAKYYYKHNADARVRRNPLIHFVMTGSAQGKRTCANDAVAVPIAEASWKKFIPIDERNTPRPPPLCRQQPIAVIIRIERGGDAHVRTVASVLAAANRSPFEVLVINECPSDAVVAGLLDSVRHRGVLVHTDEGNPGISAAVNKGCCLFPHSDVVLLAGGTQVTHGWLDNLVSHAYSQGDIGTVTPFSNEAGICGFPSVKGFRSYRDWENLDLIAGACEQANQGRSVQIPAAGAVCTFIRHDCLQAVGPFDSATFATNWGATIDFAIRATERGWRHVLACDTFVFHEGADDCQGSGASSGLDRCNALWNRYPQHEARMVQYEKDDHALPFRVAALSVLDASNPLPTILFIAHSLGGGTEKHLEELRDSLKGRIRAITLRPERQEDDCGGFLLQLFDGDRGPNLLVSNLIGQDFLPQFLSKAGIKRIHVHHTIGSTYHLRHLIDELAIPYDITIHDYFTVCPQVNMITVQGNYCGEPAPDACTDCVLQRPSWGAHDIHWWRLENQALIERAERVICPSEDVRQRMSRYVPHAHYRVISHEMLESAPNEITFPPLSANETMRVAILGAVSVAKGSLMLIELAKRVKADARPIEFHVIGYVGRDGVESFDEGLLTYTGSYADDTLLDAIKQYDPHLIFFPARWPETYSYTLSAALAHGAPIVAPRGGAFTERLRGRPLSLLHDMSVSADDILRALESMRGLLLETTAASSPAARVVGGRSSQPIPLPGEQSSFYCSEYLAPLRQNAGNNKIDYRVRAAGSLSVLIMPELNERGPTACSYIRLVLPLLAAQEQGKLSVYAVSVESLFLSVADVLVVNRVAIESPDTVSAVLSYCRGNGIKVVYDIDDDLLRIEEHAESVRYAEKLPCVLRMLVGADQVWASTPTLAARLNGLTRECVVVPNGLDEKLWLSPLASGCNDKSETIRLVYMGTRTHDADLEMILPALERLRRKHGSAISLDIIGVVAREDLIPSWATRIPISFRTSESYPLFVRWVRSLGGYDIGLAPLVPTHFNAGKSEIKLFDYATLGACTVASPHGGYSTTGVDGVNCLFAENSGESWYEKLDSLIEGTALRLRLQEGARDLLHSSGLNGRHQATRLRALHELVATGSTSVVPAPLYLAQPPAGAADSEAIVLSLGKNRFRRILSHSFIVGEGIEVGALQNPLPVSEATTVRYVDRLSREDLYLHYPELRQYNLVDPDILDNGEELATVSDCSQDFIIANHFLEHCEDTLKALRNFARALRPGGRIFLALPDKRFTFDKNRAVTQLSHILRDYEQGADSSRSEHFREWASLVEPFFGRCYQSGEETQARAEQLMKEEYSIHFHCWTPREVHELLEHAITVLRFPLEVEYFLSTEEEMIIILRRTETERGGVLEPKEMLAPLNDSHPAGVGFRGSPASNSASAETLGAASPDAVVTRSQPSLPHQ